MIIQKLQSIFNRYKIIDKTISEKPFLLVLNYSNLCHILREPTKAGNSKDAQLKEFERYFNFEKFDVPDYLKDKIYGTSKIKCNVTPYIIYEVYKVPKPYNYQTKMKKHEDYLKRLKDLNIDIIPMNTYISETTPILHQYKNGIKRKISPKQVLNGNTNTFFSNYSGTSFPEQALYFYIKQYKKAKNHHILSNGLEIDIFLPDDNIAIEYNGMYWHNFDHAQNNDMRKKEFLKEHNIKLITVYESKEDKVIEEENAIYHKLNTYNPMIENVLNMLNIEHETINIDDNLIKIYEQYITAPIADSAQDIFPDIIQYWDYEKNGKIKPNMIKKNSTKKFWLICPRCGESVLVSIPIFLSKKCEFCGTSHKLQMPIIIIKNNDIIRTFRDDNECIEEFKINPEDLYNIYLNTHEVPSNDEQYKDCKLWKVK